MEAEIDFCGEWLVLKKNQFKIMAVVTVLADKNRAFRGTLNDLCDELGIGRSSANRASICKTLELLTQSGNVKVIKDLQIYTISLSESVSKSKNVKTIKKAWYDLIRDCKSAEACSWDSLLKVFLTIFDSSNDDIITNKSISDSLGGTISESTVGKCIRTLCKIDYQDFRLVSKVINKRSDNGQFYCVGRVVEKGVFFE